MREIVLDELTMDGMRHMKVISDQAVSKAFMLSYVSTPALELAQVNCFDTSALSLFYGEVSWPLRGPVEIRCEGWKSFRRMLGWKLIPGERVSEAMKDAVLEYFMRAHRLPNYAFMRRLPHAVENGIDVEGLILLEAEWALEGCLLIGG